MYIYTPDILHINITGVIHHYKKYMYTISPMLRLSCTSFLLRICDSRKYPSCAADEFQPKYESEGFQVGYRPSGAVGKHRCAIPMTLVRISAWITFLL